MCAKKSCDGVIKLLGYDRMILCASKKYLDRYGKPKTPQDLLRHQCLVYAPQKNRNMWPFFYGNNLITVTVNPQLSSNSIRVLLNAASNGLGIARLPLLAIQDKLENGVVQSVLDDCEPPATPIYAIFSPGRIIPPKVQVFIRFLEGVHGSSF